VLKGENKEFLEKMEFLFKPHQLDKKINWAIMDIGFFNGLAYPKP